MSWAGYPKSVVTDRGLHNRRIFAQELSAAEVQLYTIGLEAPYQLGRTERHGGMWKEVAMATIDAREISGASHMKIMADETSKIMNERNRKSGFSPAQWVLGKQPRYGAGERNDEEQDGALGPLEQLVDPTTQFG